MIQKRGKPGAYPLSVGGVLLLCISMILLCTVRTLAKPPSGKKLIKRIQKAYNELETFSCGFRQEFQWGLAGEMEITEGIMELAQNGRFRFETPHQIMATDGTTLWRYSITGKQVLVENLNEAEQGVLPREILFDYPKKFDIVEVSDAMIRERPAYMLVLEPGDRTMGVSHVKVWVDADDSITRRMEWLDETGNRTSYNLTDIIINPPLDSARFVPILPKGVTVYDLR